MIHGVYGVVVCMVCCDAGLTGRNEGVVTIYFYGSFVTL